MMNRATLLFLLFLLSVVSAYGQLPQVRQTVIGKSGNEHLFSFAHITDVHIGERNPDFGTVGYFDQLNENDTGFTVTRLQSSVRWINENYQKEGIAFVVVSGDITGSAEKSEFLKFREIMDSLHVPYIPLMGNHDAWPYIRYQDEAPTACGDSIMNEIFAPVFESLLTKFDWDEGTRLTRWLHPESNTYSYMQNFSFVFKGHRFVFLDFNPRYHVRKKEPGIGPEAQLTDYEGGTMPYMRNVLKLSQERKEYVFLVTHHPPMKNPFAPHYAFTGKERNALVSSLQPYPYRIRGWFAGHMHRWAHYHLWRAKGLVVYETKANKAITNGGFRLLKVYATEQE